MGHLTTRHYLGMFDDASYQLMAILGYDPEAAALEGWGWADVHHDISYRLELGPGAVVRILGRITALGRTSVSSEFQMLRRSDDQLCAVLSGRTVCFDLAARRARPLPGAIIEASHRLFRLSAEPA
jgi:acyl-CoA thioester hydrolase